MAVTTSLLMVFVSWYQGRSVRWVDQDTEGFPDVMVYFPDNFMNLTPFAGEVYVTNRGSIVSTVLLTDDDEEEEEEEGEQQQGVRPQPRAADTIAMIDPHHSYATTSGEAVRLLPPPRGVCRRAAARERAVARAHGRTRWTP